MANHPNILDQPASGGGTEIIGPFAVAYNTAGITDGNNAPYGAFVGSALPSGTLVLGAWLYVTAAFDGAGSNPQAIVYPADATLADGTSQGYFEMAAGALSVNAQMAAPTTPFPGLIPTDAHTWRLLVWLNLTGSTHGTADIYALVQYP